MGIPNILGCQIICDTGSSQSSTNGQGTSLPPVTQASSSSSVGPSSRSAPVSTSESSGILLGPRPYSSLLSNKVPDQPSSIYSAPSLPSILEIVQVSLPTLQHVPKGVRSEWAALLADLSSDIVRNPLCLEKWRRLFMLPRCILASPVRGGRSHWRQTLETVRRRIRRWKAGDFIGLWSDVEEENSRWSRKRRPKAPSPNSLRLANARRAKRLTEEGQYKKALQALLSEGVARASPEVLKEMLAKHPQAPPPSLPQGPLASPPSITPESVLKAIRSFPTGSAPGPSHLRAAHLKEAVLCPSPGQASKVTSSLTGLVNLLCSGLAPPEVVPLLCGATLIACKKKGGGLRPIAVGEVLRRLVSKSLSAALKQEAIQVLSPHQLGVGVKSGCEAIVHSVSRVLEDPNSNPDECWTLLIDFSNAFNSIDRSKMFKEVRARFPSLSPWLESCYGCQPFLLLEDTHIRSCNGVQQGDPLGPLGFAAALQPIIEKVQSGVPNLKVNAWYLDDGTLVGSPSDLASALSIIEREGPSRGLRLNRAKSLLFRSGSTSPNSNPLPPDIPVADEGFSLLGCPVGPSHFCNRSVLSRVERVKECLSKLPDLQDSQLEYTLLRHCLSLPKIAFSLRTCPSAFIREATATFDAQIRDALSIVAGGPLPEWSWRKATLPCSLGGLSLRSAASVAPAAYISSTTEAQPLIEALLESPSSSLHLDVAVDELSKLADRSEWVSPQAVDIPAKQRALCGAIDESMFERTLSSAPDDRAKALVLSTSLPHAGDWLQVIPSPAFGLHLPDTHFKLCLQYWLGLTMVGENHSCPVCQSPADTLGDHQVGCGGNGDRIFRHNAIRDVIYSAAQSAALCPRKEAPALIPGALSRPADIYLPNWEGGRPAALDVTVISPLQRLTISGASSVAGHALQVAEERKRATHSEACREARVSFIPLAIETLGGWSQELQRLMKHISSLQALRLGLSRGDSFRHLAQRISITIWRGNAWLWASRLPAVAADVDGRP